MAGGTPKKISTSPGADTTPLYSPDGKYLAWRSQARAGFEADKWRLFMQDRQSGKTRDVTEKFDRSIGSFAWAPDSEFIWFSAEDHGEAPISYVDATQGKELREVARLHADDLAFGAGNRLFFTRMSVGAPNEIYHLDIPESKGNATAVTHMNDALLSQIDMQPLESFTFKGANDEEVQGFMVKPPGFDPKKKYPLKFLIHGGPQGAWGNEWTYRWNAELFAASGNYVVVMINFHGSTGYGQKFTDSISGDWGGKPYVDLMKGLDYVEKLIRSSTKTARRRWARATAVTWLIGSSATRTGSNASCRTMGCLIRSPRTARPKNFGFRNGNSKGRRGRTASCTGNFHRTCSPTNSKRRRWWFTARMIIGST